MARIRKFVAYRSLERPYTRKSKYRKKSYIKANPNCRVTKFDAGNLKRKFSYELDLVSKDALQIRDNAIEAARRTCNRTLEKKIGKSNYHLKIRIYPHHILRENPLAAGAGADRFSTGMKHSFGKPIGIAAQVRVNQCLITVYVEENHLSVARDALTKAKHKLPGSCQLVVRKAV